MLIDFLPRHEADTDADPQGGSSTKVRASDVLEQFGRDAIRLAEKLADVQGDNYRLRDERRELKRQLAEAAGKAPAEGSRVLSAADAALYDAYAALGAPEALKTALEGAQSATAELTGLKREKAIRAAAEAVGFKASVLTTLAGDLDIQTKAGKDGTPLVYVVKDGVETALTDYAAKEWADFLPALTPKASPQAPDINAGARGGGAGATITDDERKAAARRYGATF